MSRPLHMLLRSLRLALPVVTWIVLTGCGQQSYTDVSNDPNYEGMVGQRFSVAGPLLAYGIKDHSAAPIEYITLMPPPGIGGRSIVPLGTVKTGAILTVMTVRMTNRLLDDPVNYVVLLDESDFHASVPIHVDRFRGNEGPDGRTSLNPSIFHQLPRKQ